MLFKTALVTSLCIAAVLLCSFAGDFFQTPSLEKDPVHIVGEFSLGRVVGSGLRLYGPPADTPYWGFRYPTVVDQEVVGIGWDDNHILVQQHPVADSSDPVPDSSNPRWYIVVVLNRHVRSFHSYDEFVFARQRVLHVSDTIEMRDARDVYYGR